MLNGVRLVQCATWPKMKLSPECPVTPEFREETDKWLLEFFGTASLMQDGEIYHDKVENVVYGNAKTLASLATRFKDLK